MATDDERKCPARAGHFVLECDRLTLNHRNSHAVILISASAVLAGLHLDGHVAEAAHGG